VGDGDGDGYSEDGEWLAFENETREETRRDEMLMVAEGREKVPEDTPRENAYRFRKIDRLEMK
jgi:hypothetical protein